MFACHYWTPIWEMWMSVARVPKVSTKSHTSLLSLKSVQHNSREQWHLLWHGKYHDPSQFQLWKFCVVKGECSVSLLMKGRNSHDSGQNGTIWHEPSPWTEVKEWNVMIKLWFQFCENIGKYRRWKICQLTKAKERKSQTPTAKSYTL